MSSERLDNELMRAYLLDDLAWQLSRQQDEALLDDLWTAFGELEQRNRAEIDQQEASEECPLVLFERLSSRRQVEMLHRARSGVSDTPRQEPTLIPVVLDFL